MKENDVSRYHNLIQKNINKIAALNDDVDELTQMKKKMEQLKRTVEAAGNNGYTRAGSIPLLFQNAIKINLFSQMMNVLKGREYVNALSSVEDSIHRIQRQIDECNSQIKQIKKQNQSYYVKITELNCME